MTQSRKHEKLDCAINLVTIDKKLEKKTVQKINEYKSDSMLKQAQRGNEVAAMLSALRIFVNKTGD